MMLDNNIIDILWGSEYSLSSHNFGLLALSRDKQIFIYCTLKVVSR